MYCHTGQLHSANSCGHNLTLNSPHHIRPAPEPFKCLIFNLIAFCQSKSHPYDSCPGLIRQRWKCICSVKPFGQCGVLRLSWVRSVLTLAATFSSRLKFEDLFGCFRWISFLEIRMQGPNCRHQPHYYVRLWINRVRFSPSIYFACSYHFQW